MQEFISDKRPCQLSSGEIIITESKEYTLCLKLMDYILKQISVNHNQQVKGNY